MRTQVQINRTERGGTRRGGRAVPVRLLLALLIVVLLAGSGWLAERASAQSADQVFAPDVNDTIRSIVVQPDGKVLIGGDFTLVNGQTRQRLARLLPDGTLDPTFTSGLSINGKVFAIVVLRDGGIVVGGEFTSVNGKSVPSIAKLSNAGVLDEAFGPSNWGATYSLRESVTGKIVAGHYYGIRRLNSDGTPDASFSPPGMECGAGCIVRVRDSVVLDDDRILVVGDFLSIVGSPAVARIARLNPDGTVDSSFSPQVNGYIAAIEVQADGKILIGGSYTSVNGVIRTRLARLNSDGSLDLSFSPPNITGGMIYTLSLLRDGRILAGGDVSGAFNKCAILARSGAIDPSSTLEVAGSVFASGLQADEKLLIAGSVSSVNGTTRYRIARLSSAGVVERAFVATADNDVLALSHLLDGKIIVGGGFASLGGQPAVSLGQITQNGEVDTSFSASSNGQVNSLLPGPDGSLIIGGAFGLVSGHARSNLARFAVSGVIDSEFAPNPNGPVLDLLHTADGGLFVAGDFTRIGSEDRQYLARLDSDGTVITAFSADPSSVVRTLAMQPDGKIIIGGGFTSVASLPANRIARLTNVGVPDANFNASADSDVYVVLVQPDGKIVIGGAFTQINGQLQPYLARLEADGSLDTTFAATTVLGGPVYALSLQPDGRLIAGGAFTTVTAGGTPETRNHIARFNADGSLDKSWDPSADGNVNAIALLPDGTILIGGAFVAVGGQPHGHIARLSSDAAAIQNLYVSADGYSLAWQQTGAGPSLTAASFEFSTDGATFSPLGQATTGASGWQLSGLSLPLFQNFWVRARGEYPSGQSNGSTSAYTSVRLGYVRAVDVLMDTTVSGGTAVPSNWRYTVDGKQVAGDASLRVLAGVYTVTVAPPPDYTLTNVGGACAQVGGAIQLTAANNGGDCELTYTRDTGTITFVKVVDGGTAQPASFSFAAGGKSAGHNQQMTLGTGVYTVTEGGPTGYAVRAAGGACALENGAIRLTVTKAGGTCTVTNTAPVTFSKIVEGGVSVPGDWSFAVAGQPVAHGGQMLLAPGTYSVTESGPSGYTLVAAGGDCTLSDGMVWLTVPAGSGSTATCTLTNRREQGTIAFATTVEGEGATAADFTYTVLGQTRGDGGQLTLDTDLYTVSVAKPSTFVPRVASGACSLVAGAVRLEVTQAGGTCAVTFTRLVRFVNVVEGGTRSPGAWSFRVPIDGVEQIVFHNRDVLLAPGTYTVTQQGAVDYYSLADASGNCTLDKGKIIVNAPGSGICTVTNVRNTGGIWFNRIVQGDGGARPEDWVVMVENLPVSMGVTVTLDTDTYTVYESGPTDYALTLAGGICSLYKGNIVLEVTEAGGECLLVSTPGVGPVGFVVAPSGGTALPSAWEFAVAGQRIPHNGALLMPIGVFPISLVGPADYVVTAATGICSYDGTDISLVVGTDGGTCNLALTYDPNAPDPGPDPDPDPEPSDAAFIYLPAVQR